MAIIVEFGIAEILCRQSRLIVRGATFCEALDPAFLTLVPVCPVVDRSADTRAPHLSGLVAEHGESDASILADETPSLAIEYLLEALDLCRGWHRKDPRILVARYYIAWYVAWYVAY